MKEEYNLPENVTFAEAKLRVICAVLESQCGIKIIDNNGEIKIYKEDTIIATFSFAINQLTPPITLE